MTKCPYLRCRFNCSDKNEHKIFYAKMRRFYDKSKKINSKKTENKLSSKVNWKVYNEFIKQNSKENSK